MSMFYLGFGCDTQLSDNLLYETPLRQADQQYYHRSGSQELQQMTLISRIQQQQQQQQQSLYFLVHQNH